MPKIQAQAPDIGSLSDIAIGTYSNIQSVVINSSGIITAVNTYTPAGGGLVNSVSGTAGQISVSPTVGIPQIDLVSVITPITDARISSITTDSYGRISSITTTSVAASGTFPAIKAITINSAGGITAIDTSPIASLAPSVMTNTVITSSTTITSSREFLYVYTNPQSGRITLDLSTSSNFYMAVNGNFTFDFINGPNLLTGVTINGIYSAPVLSISIVVNNAGGYQFTPSTANPYYPTSWNYNSSAVDYYQWAGGVLPQGTAGRIENYNFVFSYYYSQLSYPVVGRSWASMSTYG
jgi:hypothetical protein